MTKRLVFYSVVIAIGALRLVMKLTVSNAKKQKKHKLLKLSNVLYGLPTVSAILGLVIGSFFGGISILKYGYINLLTWIGILFLISAFSPTDSSFMFLPLVDLCVGVFSLIISMFISKITQAKSCGMPVGSFQFSILFAISSNYLLTGMEEENLRYILWILAVLAAFFIALMFFVSESRCWLIEQKNRYAKGLDLIINSKKSEENSFFLNNYNKLTKLVL